MDLLTFHLFHVNLQSNEIQRQADVHCHYVGAGDIIFL